jgi:hypothetical protein
MPTSLPSPTATPRGIIPTLTPTALSTPAEGFFGTPPSGTPGTPTSAVTPVPHSTPAPGGIISQLKEVFFPDPVVKNDDTGFSSPAGTPQTASADDVLFGATAAAAVAALAAYYAQKKKEEEEAEREAKERAERKAEKQKEAAREAIKERNYLQGQELAKEAAKTCAENGATAGEVQQILETAKNQGAEAALKYADGVMTEKKREEEAKAECAANDQPWHLEEFGTGNAQYNKTDQNNSDDIPNDYSFTNLVTDVGGFFLGMIGEIDNSILGWTPQTQEFYGAKSSEPTAMLIGRIAADILLIGGGSGAVYLGGTTIVGGGASCLFTGIGCVISPGTVLAGSVEVAAGVVGVTRGMIGLTQNIKNLSENSGYDSRLTVLQKGGHTLYDKTIQKLGLTKEEGKYAIESLKKDNLLKPNDHFTIMSNGHVIGPDGTDYGDLRNYLP